MKRTTFINFGTATALAALLMACGGSGGDDPQQQPQPIVATVTATVAAYETTPGADTNNFEPVGFDLKFSIPMNNVKGGTWRVVGPLGEVGGSAKTLADGKSVFIESAAPLYPHAEYRIEVSGLQRDDGVPVIVNTPASVRVPVREMMALGDVHACVLRGNGRIRCWGQGATGVLGNGRPDTVGDEPGEMGNALTDVDLGSSASGQPLLAVEVVAGAEHNCARLESGQVKCWGANSQGQLGRGDDTPTIGAQANEMGDKLPAVNLGTGRTAVYLSAGSRHTCAVLDNAQLKCWGSNARGALGAGVLNATLGLSASEMGDALPAVNLGTGQIPVHVSAATHTCAVLHLGDVKCWGDNTTGQLGQGDLLDRGQQLAQMGDALLRVDMGVGGARRVATGAGHTCVILIVGVKCWGTNVLGALGLGDEVDRGGKPGDMGNNLPSVTTLGTGVWALSMRAGQGVTCAKLDDQKLYCWGAGSHGQLGLDSAEPRGGLPEHAGKKAVLLPADKRITDIAVSPSGLQVCARLSDDAGYHCWGSNIGQVVRPGADFKENIGDGAGEMATVQAIDLGLAVQ
jgi:alpha-tubulin suppressor-like RCC1 family protein